MSEQLKEIVYSRNTIEFVTVAVQFCDYIENIENSNPEDVTDKLTKILPLLYLKTTLVPSNELESDEDSATTVTEEDYNYILSKIYSIYSKDDTYLEVFLDDMKYSETPISASISEDISDIYQDLKNFITIYERGILENMNDALYICIENFKNYWGQKLVNVLRALHSLKYSININIDEEESNTNYTEDIW